MSLANYDSNMEDILMDIDKGCGLRSIINEVTEDYDYHCIKPSDVEPPSLLDDIDLSFDMYNQRGYYLHKDKRNNNNEEA